MPTDLSDAFNEVVGAWNESNYIKVGKYLDLKDFIMKRIDDAGSIVAGVDNLLAYLVVQAQQKPKFNPEVGGRRTWKNDTVGQIWGTGTYIDNSIEDTPPVNIRFTFTFRRKTDRSDWLLVNAFAAQM
jgi:hypothetical protein